MFYGTITDFLGFRPDSDEWKVMAMASYVKGTRFDNKIKKLYKLTSDGFELDLSYFNYYKFDREKYFFSEKFISEFGKPRNKTIIIINFILKLQVLFKEILKL